MNGTSGPRPTPEITRRFARYIVASRIADIPDGARREGVRSIVNWLGCAVGGSRQDAVNHALAALDAHRAMPQATVLGRRERLDLMHAALVNGISSHVFDFDDTHLRTLLHPSVPVASALFALSERRKISGAEFLHAFIVGVEIESRIANAIYENHNSDWYITGTSGPRRVTPLRIASKALSSAPTIISSSRSRSPNSWHAFAPYCGAARHASRRFCRQTT